MPKRKIEVTKKFLEQVTDKLKFLSHSQDTSVIANDFNHVKEIFNDINGALDNDEIDIDNITEELAEFYADYASYIQYNGEDIANELFGKYHDEIEEQIGISKEDVVASFSTIFHKYDSMSFDPEEEKQEYLRTVNQQIASFNGVTKDMKDKAKLSEKIRKINESLDESIDEDEDEIDDRENDDIDKKYTIDDFKNDYIKSDDKSSKEKQVVIDDISYEEMLDHLNDIKEFKLEAKNQPDLATFANSKLEAAGNEKERINAAVASYPTLKKNWDSTPWYHFFKNPAKYIRDYKALKNVKNILKNESEISEKTLDTLDKVSNGKIKLGNVVNHYSDEGIDTKDYKGTKFDMNVQRKLGFKMENGELKYVGTKELENEKYEEDDPYAEYDEERVFGKHDEAFPESTSRKENSVEKQEGKEFIKEEVKEEKEEVVEAPKAD